MRRVLVKFFSVVLTVVAGSVAAPPLYAAAPEARSTAPSGPPARAPDKLYQYAGLWSPVMLTPREPGGPIPAKGKVPLTPEYDAKRETLRNMEPNGEIIVGRMARCIPPGMPMMYDHGFYIAATADQLVMWGAYGSLRLIAVNRRTHTAANLLFPSYEGETLAWLENDTLLLSTVGIDPTNEMFYGLAFDDDSVRIEERWNINGEGFLDIDMTIHSKAFITPWKQNLRFRRSDSTQFRGELRVCDDPSVGTLNLTPPAGGFIPPGASP